MFVSFSCCFKYTYFQAMADESAGTSAQSEVGEKSSTTGSEILFVKPKREILLPDEIATVWEKSQVF